MNEKREVEPSKGDGAEETWFFCVGALP